MSYKFRNIGRLLLAASTISLGVASVGAQSTTAPGEVNPSRFDLFMGYSYFGAHGVVKPANIRYSSIDEGAMLSGAYYFNKYVGGEVIAGFHPDGQNDGMYAVSAGPIFRAPMQNFTLFAHGLVGGAHLGGPNSDVPATFEHEPYRWGASLTVGGGMDYDLPFHDHRFGLRLFQADYRYTHASYGPPVPIPTFGILGGRTNLSAVELSTGILVHFGHIVPPPPVTYACSVTAPTGDIYPGDQVTVTGTAGMLNPKRDATYSWTSDSGAVSSTSNVVTIDTKALSPATFTVKGHVSQGMKPGQFADCSAQFTVKPFLPPTVGCSANPSTINVGDSSTITANGSSPQNRPLTYSYSATAGSISGNTSTATLTTTGVAPGTITVTCNVVDDKGQTASQMTTVTIATPAAPVIAAAVNPTSLCTINFDRDAKRPARVDNEAKACLDDIALNAQRDPNAKLAVVGSAASTEMSGKNAKGTKLAQQRAVNTKAYLVTEKGVDASRISVYTGTSDGKTAATTLIPSGATMSTDGLTPVDESAVKATARTAPPAKKHAKK
jgi:outer membrane protein OmpA-like peptidoglycan-associated protein